MWSITGQISTDMKYATIPLPCHRQLGAQYRQCALHAAARAPADTPTHCSAGNAFLMVSETR